MLNQNVRIYRASSADSDDARRIVDACCEEIGVMVRDTPEMFAKYFADDAGIWLAAAGQVVVGCVILRPLPQIPGAAEVKRLYVVPERRGGRIAHELMAALHSYASAYGYEWIYLDTKDDLQAAIRFYQRLGYVDCERYNDNPLRRRSLCRSGCPDLDFS